MAKANVETNETKIEAGGEVVAARNSAMTDPMIVKDKLFLSAGVGYIQESEVLLEKTYHLSLFLQGELKYQKVRGYTYLFFVANLTEAERVIPLAFMRQLNPKFRFVPTLVRVKTSYVPLCEAELVEYEGVSVPKFRRLSPDEREVYRKLRDREQLLLNFNIQGRPGQWNKSFGFAPVNPIEPLIRDIPNTDELNALPSSAESSQFLLQLAGA